MNVKQLCSCIALVMFLIACNSDDGEVSFPDGAESSSSGTVSVAETVYYIDDVYYGPEVQPGIWKSVHLVLLDENLELNEDVPEFEGQGILLRVTLMVNGDHDPLNQSYYISEDLDYSRTAFVNYEPEFTNGSNPYLNGIEIVSGNLEISTLSEERFSLSIAGEDESGERISLDYEGAVNYAPRLTGF